MNFQISGHRTALTSIQLITKSEASSLPEKAQDVNDLKWHLIDVWVGAKIENIALLTMALTSGVDISVPTFEPQEDILNIHHDIN